MSQLSPDPVRLQRWTFLVLFVFSAWLFWRTAEPLFVPLFIGILIAVGTFPMYQRIVARSPRREAAAAIGLTASVMLAAMGVIAFVFTVVAAQLVAFAREVLQRYKHGGVAELLGPALSARIPSIIGDPEEVFTKIASSAETAAGSLASLTGSVLAFSVNGLVVTIFAALTAYYLLREGAQIRDWIISVLPLPRSQVVELIRNFRDTTQAMLLGTGVTALYQGVIAFFGYWIFRVPNAILWASLTGVASLLPGIGTALVWAPIAAWLIIMGNIGRGLGVIAWGALLVVGVADYILRPKLLGSKVKMNELLVFIAIFGGIEGFGLLGLILGPIFVAVFVSLVRIYERDYKPDGAL
jgi:predicted PurR-regulated permease PerM